MCRLRSCCMCCSLKTGSIISGVVGIILAILTIILMLTTRAEFKNILLDWIPSDILKIILIINLVMTILISLFLIIGVIKENVLLMLPWVVLGIMCAIGVVVSVIYTAVVFYVDGDDFNGTLWLIIGFVSIVIFLYMWLVVFNYFQMVRETKGRYMKAPYRR